MSLADPRLAPGHNWGVGRNPFSWWEYDRLPPIVRRVLQNSPIDLGSHRVTLELAGRTPPADVAKREWAYACSLARRLCADTYGPDHPNATPADRRGMRK